MNGKGDTQRPLSVSQKEFEDSFERIFGKKESLPIDKKDITHVNSKESRDNNSKGELHA